MKNKTELEKINEQIRKLEAKRFLIIQKIEKKQLTDKCKASDCDNPSYMRCSNCF